MHYQSCLLPVSLASAISTFPKWESVDVLPAGHGCESKTSTVKKQQLKNWWEEVEWTRVHFAAFSQQWNDCFFLSLDPQTTEAHLIAHHIIGKKKKFN